MRVVHVDEMDVVQIEFVRARSAGRLIVIFSNEGVGGLSEKVLVSTIFNTEEESKTSWLLGVYPTLRAIGDIVTLAVPFYI
jgi:hypothetical protein